MILESCRSNMVSLLPVEIKFKMAPMFRNNQYFYLQLKLLLRLGHSQFDSLEAKGNHLANIPAGMLFFYFFIF